MTNEPYKAVIIDDEMGSIQSLLWELENFKELVTVVKHFLSPKEAIPYLNAHKNIDILFLDIEMPEINGFELLRQVHSIDFNVIFTTAYDEYVLKALKINAIDYLLKPVDEEDLGEALSKVKSNVGMEFYDKLKALFDNMNQHNSKIQKVVFPVVDGLEFFKVEEIVRCQSDSNYTHIHLVDGKKIVLSKTLTEVEDYLSTYNFVRIHHSHLINPIYLKKYNRGKAGSIILEDGTPLPVSRSRKNDFLDNVI